MNYFLKKEKNKWFTLTEILIAIFILSLGIYAIIIMFPSGIKIIKASQMATQAVELAQKKVEETISDSYSSVAVGTVSENPLLAPFGAFRRERIIVYVDPVAEFHVLEQAYASMDLPPLYQH